MWLQVIMTIDYKPSPDSKTPRKYENKMWQRKKMCIYPKERITAEFLYILTFKVYTLYVNSIILQYMNYNYILFVTWL